jgi:hypothetical protein
MVSIKMPDGKIERMLEDLANIKPADDSAMERWLRNYGQALPAAFYQDVEELERAQDERLHAELAGSGVIISGRTNDEIRQSARMRMWDLGYKLRRAWDEPTQENKEWYIHELRRWAYVLTEPKRSSENPLPPPSPTGFQQALRHFQNLADMAKHCGCSECRAPYFFADDPRDKFCDDPRCSAWAVKRSKKISARKRRERERREGKKRKKQGKK